MMSDKPVSTNISLQSDWLLGHRKQITSQLGEDGILEKIFEIIPEGNRWCVEFGAGDGKLFSNTYNLIVNYNWSSVQVEANPDRFSVLSNRYSEREDVYCLNRIISFEGEGMLDDVLSSTPVPEDFDLLSIDIDGNDYHVWSSLERYHPKVLVIEFNPTIPHYVIFVQKRDFNVNHGCSLAALVELGKAKGYELICSTQWNGIFVDKKYYSEFNISDNSIWKMNRNYQFWTYIFQAYDGTIFLGGMNKLLWHDIPIDLELLQEMIQVLSPEERVFPDHLR
ncbi:MAG: hypothetical protein Q6L68_06555 [Thermostichus sp. DG02_5_bins_236]